MYVLDGEVRLKWVGDGCGPMSVASAQQIQASTLLVPGNAVAVPGADAPTSANITTACATFGTNMAALLNANLAQIQGFASGGG